MTWTEWKQVEGFTFDDIIYEKKSIIESGAYAARVTINRPARHNAVTDVTGNEMRYAFDDASRDPMVGIVVITGAGDRAFCSGGDVNWEAGENYGIGFSYGSSMQKMLRLTRVPVLAAVKGYAIGGGNHLAYMCDFTVAADNAIFGQVGPRVGSPPTVTTSPTSPTWWVTRRPARCGCCAGAITRRKASKWGWRTRSSPWPSSTTPSTRGARKCWRSARPASKS